MSKKHRTEVPDFSSHKPKPGKPVPTGDAAAPKQKAPVPRAKPQATSSKSGRRGS